MVPLKILHKSLLCTGDFSDANFLSQSVQPDYERTLGLKEYTLNVLNKRLKTINKELKANPVFNESKQKLLTLKHHIENAIEDVKSSETTVKGYKTQINSLLDERLTEENTKKIKFYINKDLDFLEGLMVSDSISDIEIAKTIAEHYLKFNPNNIYEANDSHPLYPSDKDFTSKEKLAKLTPELREFLKAISEQAESYVSKISEKQQKLGFRNNQL